MSSILKLMRALADANRLRVALMVRQEELSVAELQEILSLGQSTISTHLSRLKAAGLVQDRRVGKNILYRLNPVRAASVEELMRAAAAEIPETTQDRAALALALERRQDRVRAYFDSLAGKFGRQYVPGRSWKGLAEMLLSLLPPLVIADLGAGEGTLSQLLAQNAERVIAVDNSGKMVEFGAALAREHGVDNLEYRQGDLEALPINHESVDVALFSQSLHHAQHPERAISEAYRILRPGGRVLVLDLVRHHFEQARELYADVWLGFTAVELRDYLCAAGLGGIRTAVVHRESEAPHFETILAVAGKASKLSEIPASPADHSTSN